MNVDDVVSKILVYAVMFIVLVAIICIAIWGVLYGIYVTHEPSEDVELSPEEEREKKLESFGMSDCFNEKVRELEIDYPAMFSEEELGC